MYTKHVKINNILILLQNFGSFLWLFGIRIASVRFRLTVLVVDDTCCI